MELKLPRVSLIGTYLYSAEHLLSACIVLLSPTLLKPRKKIQLTTQTDTCITQLSLNQWAYSDKKVTQAECSSQLLTKLVWKVEDTYSITQFEADITRQLYHLLPLMERQEVINKIHYRIFFISSIL